MHSNTAWLASSFVVLMGLAGCGQRSETSQTTVDTSTVAPVTPPATDPGMPAWVAQVRQGEAELEQIVEQGRLGEVHDQAVKVQGTLKQVTDQAGSLTPEQSQQLTAHVKEANAAVDAMHDAGDAGDLTKAKAKFQELKTHLRAIEGVFGVTAP